MSWSNVIKGGEDVPFIIRSFDPDSMDESPGLEPVRGASKGALVLPGGTAVELRASEQEEEVESHEEKMARLEREAYEKGFEQGRKDGLALEQKQIEEQHQQMEALFEEIRGLKPALFRDAEQDLVTLSTLIARRIVREEIKTDPSVIRRTVRAALDFVADRSHLKITVHPEDMEEIRTILPELASMTEGGRFQVTEDEAVGRGGCILDTGFGKINATIQDQCDLIEKAVEQAFHGGEKEKS
jgi:flagellar biosynthesis/type III secretory pathway protein FliH